MAFISVCEDLVKKSFTSIENKFITKYLPVLDATAIKVYLYALYVYQNNLTSYTAVDFSKALNLDETEILNFFKYLEEFELVSILCESPLEIKILDCENVCGTPKKYKPAKYADFTKNVQSIIKGRMISTHEFMEYFYLLEEYCFDQNALIMIIAYCVSLKGDDIKLAYIKKVAKSFANEGATSAKKVEEKLSSYTSSTPALLNLFSALGINRRPDVDDEKFYKKWTVELGFEEKSIICAAKHFKAKTVDKIDVAIAELYKNRKFDVKEIEDYCKNKNSIYIATTEIARSLGVYMQSSAPYVENYVNVWFNFGYDSATLIKLANYCFIHGNNSFDLMNDFIKDLYDQGIVTEGDVNEHLNKLNERDKLIKTVLTTCGLTRKIISWDIQCLQKWQSWGFSNDMILEAAKLSAGKSNPIAYINGILSSWKNNAIFNVNQIETVKAPIATTKPVLDKSVIERHFANLRNAAEQKAENSFKKALNDKIYSELYKKLNSLNIKLAFTELRDENEAKKLSEEIEKLEIQADARLKELKINKNSFEPNYSCKICNDTGYDKNGKQCDCLIKFINSYNG